MCVKKEFHYISKSAHKIFEHRDKLDLFISSQNEGFIVITRLFKEGEVDKNNELFNYENLVNLIMNLDKRDDELLGKPAIDVDISPDK